MRVIKKTFESHYGHLLLTADIYRQAQAKQTWCPRHRLGVGHCVYGKIRFFVLPLRKALVFPGGVGMLPSRVSVWMIASVMSDSCDPMDCRPPGSSVQEILQARTLEWVAMPSSRGSSQHRG